MSKTLPDGEPIVHSHYTDALPDDHVLAYEMVYCQGCGASLHCSNNECMQTWLEWGDYALCTKCFPLSEVLDFTEFKNKCAHEKIGKGKFIEGVTGKY